MEKFKIDIICPKCQCKAKYYTEAVGNYVLRPNKQGVAICSWCGLHRPHDFSKKDYFYKIQIKNREVYARSRENFIRIKEYFRDNLRQPFEPDFDYPALFYKHRLEIVEKIERFLKEEE